MNKQQVLLQLFVRESEQQALQNAVSIDTSLVESQAFIDWHRQKREITTTDVAGTHWIKTCTEGYIPMLLQDAKSARKIVPRY
ncbi:hypothetical protein [Psychromonas sp. Urea-02u-13]|uniref:hypothetical protein n=1 Tax=Psychromonas sp. Urea-02u-13 TaxID=2058326 RepID=UPI000C335332|nr:hypothetical protein [Psychromonas sp. Urea-02u-13]PKG38595.1 hypothetical protein CXF74_12820 [Psychromonas sp. Urea-02u-13]